MVGDYVELEPLPKMIYHKQMEQVQFTEDIFRNALYIHSNDAIVKRAHDLAKTYGLAGMDALHAASAIEGGADELLTFEKPTKPFFRIPESLLKVVSLHEVAGPETAGG
jgi:predicted nucleic acid-binding protein